jgi:hypothetical protein
MWHWGGGGIHWWGWFIGFLLIGDFGTLSIFLIAPVAHSFAPKDSRPVAARVRGLLEPGDWMRS